MLIPFKKYSLHDLKRYSHDFKEVDEILRQKYSSCCIDDNRFDEIERLALRGYRLVHYFDVLDAEQIRGFDIILCDIDGVGVYRDGHGSGVNLMKSITETFPQKYIVGYSGLQPKNKRNRELIDGAKSLCDHYVFKRANIPVEQWVEVLDNAMRLLDNPYDNWKRIRNKIIINNPNIVSLDKIEDYYVRYILSNRNEKYHAKAKAFISALGVSADMKELLGGLIASLFVSSV